MSSARLSDLAQLRIGKEFLIILVLGALLATAGAAAYYFASLRSYETSKSEETRTALQLVEAFFDEYSEIRSQFDSYFDDDGPGSSSGEPPVPSSFRAHVVERFNQARLGEEQMRITVAGVPGRAIRTAPGDDALATAISGLSKSSRPSPAAGWLTVDGQPIFRTVYPSLATQQSCVDCHNTLQPAGPAWKLGDVMGAVAIDAPVGPFLRRSRVEAAFVAATVFIVIALLSLYVSRLHGRELSQRVTSEAAIQHNEERFRDFAESASDWFWETDTEHRFTHISDRIRDSGFDPTLALGKRREELATPAVIDSPRWTAYRAAIEAHRPFRDFIYVGLDTAKKERYLSVSGKPVFDDTGKFGGYRGCARDVTAQIVAETQLRDAKTTAEAANRSKSEFLANMSHELRTPLNAVIGFAELLAKETFGPVGAPQYREYAHDIATSGENLLAIINDILDMSKIEAGQIDLHDDIVDMAHVIASCRRLIVNRADAAGVTIDYQTPENLRPVRADGVRIKQILLNLLSNAVKFTPAKGHIDVSARENRAGDLEITVADTGFGMTQEQIAVALQPFRQVDNSLTRRQDGTGLGLPLVKSFTEMHGGSLKIRSTPGRGTTVIVTLPHERILDVTSDIASRG